MLNAIGRVNKRFYEELVQTYMQFMENLTLTIPKVEHIKKENKTIDDLLTWNREVKYVLG